MINIKSNIATVKADLATVHARIQAASTPFFANQQLGVRQQGRVIVQQVVYASVPEGQYVRRGTSTADKGILNSITTSLRKGGGGLVLGISSSKSVIADTVPKTVAGRSVADTYAAFMITGGGFLEPLGTDVRDFLDVWANFFSVTIPPRFVRDVVVPAVGGTV